MIEVPQQPGEPVGLHLRLRRPGEADVRRAAVGPVPDQHPLAVRGERLGELADAGHVLAEPAARREHPGLAPVVADDVVSEERAVDLCCRHSHPLSCALCVVAELGDDPVELSQRVGDDLVVRHGATRAPSAPRTVPGPLPRARSGHARNATDRRSGAGWPAESYSERQPVHMDASLTLKYGVEQRITGTQRFCATRGRR